jgi:hypothetical protein
MSGITIVRPTYACLDCEASGAQLHSSAATTAPRSRSRTAASTTSR